MNIFNYLNSAFCAEFAIAMIHFLWQGFAIAGIAMIIVNIFGKKSSRFRYGVYVASLFVMVFTLAVTYVLIDVQKPQIPQSHYAEITPANKNTPEIVMESNPPQRVIPDYNPSPERHSETEIAEPYEAVKPSKDSFSFDWRQFTPYLTGFYFLGVIVMTFRLLLGLHGGQRLRKISETVKDKAILNALTRQAKLVGLNFVPAILFCKRVLVPTVVGVFKPSILLPLSFASGLSSEQIEMLLAHELAHIRRYDPLVNIVQRIIEALLFFHPAVWYISHKIRIERENCCDDIVLQIGGKPAEYALCLVEIAQQTLSVISKKRIPAEVMNAVNNPSKLSNRIRRLLGSPEKQQFRLRHIWLIAFVAIAILTVLAINMKELDASTPKETRLTIKSNDPNGANEDAEELMGEFQQALKDFDWNKALSLCSDKVKSYAANFESLEKFFNDVVPVEKIKELKEVQVSGYGGQVNMRGLYQCFIRLLEPDSLPAVKWEPTISWVWYLQKNSSGWEIDFQQIPLNEWIEQDTNRQKNEHEKFLERQRILREGLKLTLIPLSESFVIGRSMEFRVELKNVSDSPIEYWSSIHPFVSDSMTIKAPDGIKVKHIGDLVQIGEAPETINPNQTIVLKEKYDVASQYLITNPGTYSFQLKGYDIPVIKSNIVTIEVEPGEISNEDLVLQKLIEIAPEDWIITKNKIRDNGISILMIGSFGGKSIGTGIEILINPSKSYLEANGNKAEFFGQSKWGNIYINSLKAETLWPDYKEQIINALNIEGKGDIHNNQIKEMENIKPFISIKHSDRVHQVLFSPDGSLVLSESFKDKLKINDTSTGSLKKSLPLRYSANSMAISSDGQFLAVGTNNGKVELWDIKSFELVKTFPVTKWSIYAVALSPDGKMLGSCAADGTIQLWDIASEKMLYSLGQKDDRMISMDFSDDSKFIAALNRRGKTSVWDVSTGQLVGSIHIERISESGSIAFRPKRDDVIIAAPDGIRLWNPKNPTQIQKINIPDSINPEKIFKLQVLSSAPYSRPGYFGMITVSDDCKTAAAPLEDGSIVIWDIETKKILQKLSGSKIPDFPGGGIEDITFSADKKLLASANRNGTVEVYKLSADVTGDESGTQVLEIKIAENTTKPNEEQWGGAVDGVQVRLRAEKLVCKDGEVIQLLLDLQNAGKDDIMIAAIAQQCEVECDGQWFEWTGATYAEVLAFPLRPDTKKLNAMQILIPKSWTSKAGDKPLKLTPGKHTIRVNFKPMVGRIYKSDPEPSPAISNSLDIEIVEPAKSPSEIGNGYGSMGAKINIKPTADGNSFEPMEIVLAETGSAALSENIETGVVLDVNDTIKYIEIDGQRREVNWVLRVVTSYIYEKNLDRARYHSKWFLKKSGMEEEFIASDISKMIQIDDIKVSPDGRYLAVQSQDILGTEQILEVIHLPLLLEQKQYKVLQSIDPYPSWVKIDKWEGDKLIISSTALLTHLDKDGRVLDDSLGYLPIQQYSLSINTGHIEGVTEIVKNPAAYFLKQFATNPNNMYQSAKALVYLKEASIIPKLEKIMAQETDTKLKIRMQEVIDSVFFRFNLVESFNIINKDTTESELRRIFGNENVINDDIPIGEGEYEPGTVIYPKDEMKKLEIVWGDLENKRFPKTASISGTKSKWQISNRVTLGTKLSELERYNGRPFVLTGFGYDYSGTIIDWKYGYLKNTLGDLKAPSNRRVLLRLGPTNIELYSQEEIRSVGGDRPFLSDNPIMRKINPQAYQIIVDFNEKSAFQEYSDDKRNFSWGKENQGLRCTALAPDIVEQGMNLHTIVKLQSIPENLDKGIKQLNMYLRDAFLTLILKNKSTGEKIIVQPHDPSGGMPWFDEGGNTISLLEGNSLKPWEVIFPLATQRKALKTGTYQCSIEYSYPNEPTNMWNKNNDWDSFGFWSGTSESQSFDLKITEEIPKTAKVLLPEKLHYEKQERNITYSKEEAKEVELPIRNGCFQGMDIYFQRDGEFVMSGGCSGFPNPGDSIDNCIDSPGDGKFIYKLVIFETTEPPGHMWAPEVGDYKVLWENIFEFAAE